MAEVQAVALRLAAGPVTVADVDLPDPVPTVRGASAQVAAARTLPGKATVLAAVGVVGDQAASYASTFQTLSDIAPVFRYLFAACTVIGVVAGLFKAVQLAKHAEAAPGKRTAEPVNDNEPAAAPKAEAPAAAAPEPVEADPVIAAGDEGLVPDVAPAQAA